MSTAWRIGVDSRRCIGTSICAGTAPEHFRLVDGLSAPLADVVAPAEVIIDAADSCPVEAITVRDAADDRLIAPEE
ncbi:ferredoxin [Micromonospora sp. ALFpr18c]|uniref:ferredoxin n=1 Tax=unclassified Micromonospora TaxID=2617518 RepID=UPI00124B4977|nr:MULTISPECIES: ferredoxin [unclassified Micromonospora]KAB1945564.1 ferredoxin [Micromonospora sp. ALFpr18c]MDG4758590.1 ferredoxin [Micromonospora sp. WMMD710]